MKGDTATRSIRFGQREIVSKGLRYNLLGDLRHRAVKVSWPMFVAQVAALLLVLNCMFAGLYMMGDAPIANSSGSFLDSLFFAIETFTTVGYGDLHPRTLYGHVLVSLELFVGVLTISMITALVFVRFTRILPRIMFSDVLPIATHDGQRSLMIRLANARMNEITVAQARVWMLMTYATAEGAQFRRFEELTLLRKESPLFTLSWTVIHPIDENSPLHKLEEIELREREAAIMIVIDGFDETTGQMVRARKTYYVEDLRFGHRFVDMLDATDAERTVLNYDRFHLTEREAAAALASAGREAVREPA